MRDFKEFDGFDWCVFILEDVNNNVKICDKYNGWKLFEGCNWSELLQNQPQFFYKCDEYKGWKLFNGYDWIELLRKQPQFVDKCDEYDGWELFSEHYWYELLWYQPQLADRCDEYDGWKLFDAEYWSYLLATHPQFADKCGEYDGWKLFDGYHWIDLLQEQPQFANKCYEYKGFSKFDKKDWGILIESKNLNFIFLIYNLKEYKNNIHREYHYLLDIYDNLFKNIKNFKKYTDRYITTPEIFKLFIEQGVKDNRVNEIIDFEKVKDFILGFEDLNMLMVRNILYGVIENYKNKKEKGNKR